MHTGLVFCHQGERVGCADGCVSPEQELAKGLARR